MLFTNQEVFIEKNCVRGLQTHPPQAIVKTEESEHPPSYTCCQQNFWYFLDAAVISFPLEVSK